MIGEIQQLSLMKLMNELDEDLQGDAYQIECRYIKVRTKCLKLDGKLLEAKPNNVVAGEMEEISLLKAEGSQT